MGKALGLNPVAKALRGKLQEAPTVVFDEVFSVLSAIPGITGTIQAMEAIKYLAGVGSLLKGRLLCCDYLEMHFFEVKVKRDPGCVVCGKA